MACVALFCGLRISEVLGLQEKHIDFASGMLKIEQRFHRGGLDTCKTRKSEREVPMGYLADDLRKLFMGDRARFVFQVGTNAGRPGPYQKNFICRDDRGLLRHFLRPAAKAIGCYSMGFGWHSLRREAVIAFSASLGIGQAMRLAGHSTTEMSIEYTLADRQAQDVAVRERQGTDYREARSAPCVRGNLWATVVGCLLLVARTPLRPTPNAEVSVTGPKDDYEVIVAHYTVRIS